MFKLSAQDLLVLASMDGDIRLVVSSLNDGADVHFMEDLSIRLAAMYGHIDIVDILLLNGADIEAKDNFAIKQAAFFNQVAMVQHLMDILNIEKPFISYFHELKQLAEAI